MRIILLLLLSTCLLSHLPAQSDEPPESQLNSWRATLQFGINSEVAELLPTLREQRIEELSEEVIGVLEQSEDTSVIEASFAYLNELSLGGGGARAEQLVNEHLDRPREVVRAALSYLQENAQDLAEETMVTLRQLAEGSEIAVAVPAVRVLGSAGLGREELIELYREDDIAEDVRGEILLELGERGDRDAFTFVSELLADDEEATTTLQRYAIDTLGKLGEPRALPIILRQFDSDDALTRAYAVNALSGFDDREADEALIAALRDDFWRVRVAALESIAERELDDALPAVLYKVSRDPQARVRISAIETAAVLGTDEAWDALFERLASDRTPGDERSAILGMIVEHGPDAAGVAAMRELVQQEWETENSRVLDSVGRLLSGSDDRAFAPVVEQLMVHPNYIIQIYAVRAAGRMRLGRLRSDVEARTDEGVHRALRSAAIDALERLGGAASPAEG